MAWNKGPGDHGPWGPAPGSQPPKPPENDFDAYWRKARDGFRRWTPGGNDNERLFIILPVIGIALWLATGIFYRVESYEQAVVMRFGKFHRIAGEGLHLRWPAPVEEVLKPKVTRVNRMEVGFRSALAEHASQAQGTLPNESLMLTGDENIVDINFEVQWRIQDAKQFLFNARDPEQTVKHAAESAVREVIGRTNITPLLTTEKDTVALQARTLLQQILDAYGLGIEVVRLQMLKVDPPADVIDAFQDVQNAKTDQERARNEAESYRNDILPRAQGQSEQIIQEAKAYKDQVVARAQGEAQRFQSVEKAYAAAPEVTRRRLYLETMEQVLSGTPKVVLDSKNGAVPYLPLPVPSRPADDSEKEKAQ